MGGRLQPGMVAAFTSESVAGLDRNTQVWSSDQICHRNIAFLRQGDLVKVKGRPEVYTFEAQGKKHELPQIVVERIRVLKRRNRPPEIP
jgi:hypothetical protein